MDAGAAEAAHAATLAGRNPPAAGPGADNETKGMTMTTEFTPGPWKSNGRYVGTPNHMSYIAECRDTNGNWTDEPMAVANARLIAAAPELLAALEAYQSAQVMPIYGDSSDFIGGVVTMRLPGNSAYGWICDKHGLGYTGGCICCADERKSYSAQKDREARYARDDALRSAERNARAAIAKATGAAA